MPDASLPQEARDVALQDSSGVKVLEALFMRCGS